MPFQMKEFGIVDRYLRLKVIASKTFGTFIIASIAFSAFLKIVLFVKNQSCVFASSNEILLVL